MASDPVGIAPSMPSQADVLAWVRARPKLDPSLLGRAAKLAEECGEVMGAVIKIPEGRKTLDDLKMESAQAAICLLGVAEAAGFDLFAEVADEWVRCNPDLLAERIRREGL